MSVTNGGRSSFREKKRRKGGPGEERRDKGPILLPSNGRKKNHTIEMRIETKAGGGGNIGSRGRNVTGRQRGKTGWA